MTKITEREIYNFILDGTIDRDLLVEFATKKLAQLDHRNEKAKERAAKKRAEGDELTEKVFALVSDEPQSREDITNALLNAGEDVTVGKVGYRLSALLRKRLFFLAAKARRPSVLWFIPSHKLTCRVRKIPLI